ncbi:unnamed protein product [Urochloa humidicola]
MQVYPFIIFLVHAYRGGGHTCLAMIQGCSGVDLSGSIRLLYAFNSFCDSQLIALIRKYAARCRPKLYSSGTVVHAS